MTRSEWFAFVKQFNRCPLVPIEGDIKVERYCLECKHHYYQTVGWSNHCPRCAAEQPEWVVEAAFVADRDLPLPDARGDFEYRSVIHAYDHPQPVSERPAIPKEPSMRQELLKETA